MRYWLIVLIFITSFSTQAASSAAMCSLLYSGRLKQQVELPGVSDKWKHCALSCLLARRCGAEDSFLLGIIKELADVVGPGNAEWADLQADLNGVTLWLMGMGKSDQMCKDQCLSIYPNPLLENSCRLPVNPNL
mgnify:CR=1 FL=1|tara:strand:+ start:9675 stop:10076 length:402 start_codon:yes stop_codon:yes gene_type:complete